MIRITGNRHTVELLLEKEQSVIIKVKPTYHENKSENNYKNNKNEKPKGVFPALHLFMNNVRARL